MPLISPLSVLADEHHLHSIDYVQAIGNRGAIFALPVADCLFSWEMAGTNILSEFHVTHGTTILAAEFYGLASKAAR